MYVAKVELSLDFKMIQVGKLIVKNLMILRRYVSKLGCEFLIG